MGLSPGERLDGYEIISLVGAGGMGEVYRARDTRLQRDVALKILPPSLAGDALAFARFEREAQAVAALSHPNILAVHDFGRTSERSYVVFELLQGASLRDRLAAGPLPVRKAIDYARQTADGLAAAHEKGVVHRDIKPDNLFVTDDGRVKILDFGLAQTTPLAPRSDAAQTMTHAPITGAGTVLGTIGYMAPEQVRGQAVDHRVDLFALGCVLFEMCTGRRAFKGDTAADTMSAVLSSDPPELTLSGQPTPPALDRIVRRCLEKQPAERFQSARDLSFALDALSNLSGSGVHETVAPTGASSRRRWVLPVAAALIALVAGLGAGRVLWPADAATTGAASAPRLRAEFPSSLSVGASALVLALSPDGRWLAFSAASAVKGTPELFVRDLGTGQSVSIPGGDGGLILDWSPRSDAVLFNALTGELRRFRPGDRASTVVAPASAFSEGVRGAAWLADDTLVFAQGGSAPLARLSLADGVVAPVVQAISGDVIDPDRIGMRTDHVVALRREVGAGRSVVLVRLSDGQITDLVASETSPAVVPGHILIARPDGIVAVPFDADRLVVTGEPIAFSEAAMWDAPTGLASIAASEAGVLAFRPGRDLPLQFEWLDASGRSLGAVGPPAMYGSFSLSPDGGRIVARVLAGAGARSQSEISLRLIDLERGVSSPVVIPPGVVSDPIWTADGTRIVYRLADELQQQSPYGGNRRTLRRERLYPDAVSRDGRWLLVGTPRPRGAFAVMAVAADGQGGLQQVSDEEATSDEGSFSPDGSLVSYHSNRSGRSEIYLSRFPPTGERWQVSSDGGAQARWSSDGRSLYYLDLIGRLTRVAVPAANPERIGRPETLFDLGIGPPSPTLEQYAVHGGRFLVLRPSRESAPQSIVVISNWATGLPEPATR